MVYGTAIDRLGAEAADSARLAGTMAIDVLVAPVAIGLLAWRRRPAAAAASVLLSAFSVLSVGARDARRRLLRGGPAAAPYGRGSGVVFTAVSAAVVQVLDPDPDFPLWAEALGVAAVYALLVLVGLYVRSRRQLVASLVRRRGRRAVSRRRWGRAPGAPSGRGSPARCTTRSGTGCR